MSPPQIWRNHANAYRLKGNLCNNCQSKYFPPRIICFECKGRKFAEYVFSGSGKILTFTKVHTSQDGKDEPCATRPYFLAIVELAEGPRVTTQIVDSLEEKVVIGSKVQMVFRILSKGGSQGVIRYGYKFKVA